MPAVYRASLAQAPLPWLPVGLVDEPGGISLHPEPGWARADQVGPWFDLSDEDTPEESHLSLCDPPPRMLPPPTSFRSGWPSGGDRPCGGNFFFSISPPPRKLPQGTQVTARTEPSAGQLAALGPVAEVVVPASPPRGGGTQRCMPTRGTRACAVNRCSTEQTGGGPCQRHEPLFHLVSSFSSTLFRGATFSSLSTERVLRPHLPGTELTCTRHRTSGLGKSFNDRKRTPNITEAGRELPLYKSKARGPKLA